jgi:hypothetical protein
VGTTVVAVGDVRLTRVGYVDVTVEPEVVALTADDVRDAAWAEPVWATGGQPRVAAAAWVIEHDGACVVVDPAGAADEILRGDDAAAHQEAFAGAMAAAGVPRERVTHAISTHLDGIGMLAWRDDDGSWTRFFPHAPLLIAQRELDALDRGDYTATGQEILDELRARGDVEPIPDDGVRVTDAISTELSGGHSPGHHIVRVDSNGDTAFVIGHLALTPINLACERGLHTDPRVAFAAVRALRDSGALLVGPLWPEPGAGRWTGDAVLPVGA